MKTILCINQLLSITHEIYKFLDDRYEVGGFFLDILKTPDKVWRKGLIFKLKQNGLTGNLLNMIIDFLDARKQRVNILHGLKLKTRAVTKFKKKCRKDNRYTQS